MKDRLKAVINYKTNGSVEKFAELTGVSTRSLYNTLTRGTISTPYLIKIMDVIKELDVRWLLTGDGVMVRPWGLALSESLFLQRVSNVMRLASLMHRMDSEQIKRFQISVAQGNYPDFTIDEIKALEGGNDEQH